jgi:hypothetical protein
MFFNGGPQKCFEISTHNHSNLRGRKEEVKGAVVIDDRTGKGGVLEDDWR